MMKSSASYNSAIVNLNVGGTRFSTSKETLTWIPDSFFSSLLSGRIPSHRDETGAIFIDRDPKYFCVILAFLRTRELDVKNIDLDSLKREAEFYGISPIVSRLSVCTELNHSGCGDDLFHGMIDFPNFPDPPLGQNNKKHELTHNTLQVNYDQALELVPDTRKVLVITGHNSWIAVGYKHNVVCYKMKENFGWHQVFASPHLQFMVERIAINAKVQGMAPDAKSRMIAVAFNNQIRLWSFQDENNSTEIGTFNLQASVDALFFIGSQLVATSDRGRVGVWNAVSQHWQAQDVVPITSHDTAGSFLLLGGQNGGIYYIDMQKFPLRLKDNDLLITELYHDSSNEAITALSVYLTPKTSATVGNWIEVAYGTVCGAVRVIVQHPELVGQGFQLFQTFTVHRSPVTRVMLSEKFLVSVCGDNNHVRTWNVTRFRGMISTQPGSTPVASFKVLAIEADNDCGFVHPSDIGPHGEREEEQVFIQKVVPVSTQLYVRTSSTGKRVATIHSVDGSIITCFCLHECEGSTRMGSRPRRYLFTGHSNGNIQIWDMTTALAKAQGVKVCQGGPTEHELLELLNHCEVSACGNTVASSLPLATSLLDRVLLRSSMTSLDSFHSNSSAGTMRRNNPHHHKKETSPVPEEDNKETKSIASPLSFYEQLASTSTQKQTPVKTKSDPDTQVQHKPVSRATSFSTSAMSPVTGGMPLPGMTLPIEVSNEKKMKKPNNKSQHTRSHSFSEHQYVDTSSVSVRRQFSLKVTEKAQTHSETVTRSNSYAHQLKKKSSPEEKKAAIPEGNLTPRNSTSRNSYKSAMQQEVQSTSRKTDGKSEKHKDDKTD